jgi:hypothetical protein
MMKEVLTRRFERLLKEDPTARADAWPDLLLIDGGAGQVSAVAGIMADLGVEDIALIGVAKGIDRDAGQGGIPPPRPAPLRAARNDPVLYFVQRLRDEAHRWAIGAHRAKRAKAVSATPLDDIPGVGAARKRALLAHFGSAKAVARAGVADLMAVDGIDFFHAGSESLRLPSGNILGAELDPGQDRQPPFLLHPPRRDVEDHARHKDEDMPDRVVERQPVPEVEDHAHRVEQAARDDQGQHRPGQRGKQRAPATTPAPAHPEVEREPRPAEAVRVGDLQRHAEEPPRPRGPRSARGPVPDISVKGVKVPAIFM